ncbi:glycosyltransferase [Coraliomargarita akajimensis]|uniref:Glycosyl transferase family 2 n=1 Tax=Coraliomargarita akajimensis (strain DSM 45221 / IAM 15411 / JCM 23193 / KCTC 12865 / 04OKA010-24) TaxID=583355 RepID=D5EM61_CORAD|nr:glycosyltransferase [Coraliomargarita akajimensis]ADE55221.1 glycosyl transferase family 2 [Coraliomargarita akajimensis DSM 45221]
MDYQKHFDWVAENDAKPRKKQRGFHAQLIRKLKHHIPAGVRVLEWGCGRGQLLRALKPSKGLGVDLSNQMIAQAKEASKGDQNVHFRQGDIQAEPIEEAYDAIVLDYLSGYLTDIQAAFANLHASCHPRTRIYITSLNYLWKPLFALAQPLGLVLKQPPSNWLSTDDLVNLLELSGFEVVKKSTEQLLPFDVPIVGGLFNRFLGRLPLFRNLGVSLFIVARPKVAPKIESEVSCSVILPARNEAGNIRPALERIQVMGKKTELIIVEGNSTDDTWEVIQREAEAYTGPLELRIMQQPGKGKWDAVFAGFAEAKGDVLVIQDGDLTAPPEDLPKFYDAIVSGRAEFANGSRLVYPMESEAMRLLNFFGNKFFAMALSFVIERPIKDSLCGTKMLLREDYERLLKRIEEFGEFDPYGDFNLIFGSSLLDLAVRDVPVRYKDRTYGDTNISRFSGAALLMRMTWFGLRKLRFHR